MKRINLPQFVLVAAVLFVTRQQGFSAGSPDVILLEQPVSQSVAAGSTVTFSVVAAAPGSLQYQWSHGGQTIPGARSAVLILTNVSLADAGDYVATVQASGKKLNSSAAVLTVDGVAIVDVEGPKLKVSEPRSPYVIAESEQFTFSGTASDDTEVLDICYQQGAGPWVNLGGSTNWTFNVSLNPGTNVFQIKSVDIVRNFSATQQVVVFYSVAQPISLNVVGSGRVSGVANGQELEIGRYYSLRATAMSDSYFDHWDVDGEISTSDTLTFFMLSNRIVTATFVENPFVGLQGNYNALFYDEVAPVHESSGVLSFKLTDQGRFSGRLVISGETLSFSGQFDGSLTSSVTVNRKSPNGPITLELRLAVNSDALSGNVSGEGFDSAVVGYRNTFNVATNPATNFAGTYTLAFSGSSDPMNAPEGLGFGVVSVTTDGTVKLKGVMADGVVATQPGYLAMNGQFPVYVVLYRGQGSLLGWLTLADDGNNDATGLMLWTRPAGYSSILYPLGFANEIEVKGSRYNVPVAGTPAVTPTGPVVYLSGGNMVDPVTVSTLVSTANKVTFPDGAPNKLAIKLSSSSGLISGNFLNTGTSRKITIRGVLLQRQNIGAGFFPGADQIGIFFLGAAEDFPVFP